MTHIIIHNNLQAREEYLLSLVSRLLQREFVSLKELSSNPDYHSISKGNESIGIEDVKKLQKEMVFQPFQEISQIAVIPNSHNLTHEAQNALLKTLEEQPGATEYILLVNNEKNLLPTIISRGVKHYVKTEKAEKEETYAKPEVLEMDLVERFALVEGLVKNGGYEELLESLLHYFRQEMREAIVRSKDELVQSNRKAIETVTTAQTRLKANGNKKLVLENMLLHLEGK